MWYDIVGITRKEVASKNMMGCLPAYSESDRELLRHILGRYTHRKKLTMADLMLSSRLEVKRAIWSWYHSTSTPDLRSIKAAGKIAHRLTDILEKR